MASSLMCPCVPSSKPVQTTGAGKSSVYLVINDELQSSATGLSYRGSKKIDDRVPRAVEAWGQVVQGRADGSDWIKAGRYYLPTVVDGKRVLIKGETYCVDHDVYKTSHERGLHYRKSKNFDDVDPQVECWGAIVTAFPDGDGWVRVGSRYLPTKSKDGHELLVIRKEAERRASQLLDTAAIAQLQAPARAVATSGESSPMDALWPLYEAKMKGEGLNDAAIAAFKYTFGVLVSGANTMMSERDIDPVQALPDFLTQAIKPRPDLLQQTVVLKLNGGLGTGMGLDKAKSLLPVTEGIRYTFLDLIAKQVTSMRSDFGTELAFMLMNSFSTSSDTLSYLSKYDGLAIPGLDLEFVQNKAPKVTESHLMPADWPKNRSHEWCPPGHGDLYPALLGSGTLDKLLGKGFRYMFVSNSDNLGAVMDVRILTYFANSQAPFMMEVARRTDADKKGGHLAVSKETGGLTLRELAQCPDEDEKAFQDVTRYTYFNTNNLWVDLIALKETFSKNGGAIPLPVMRNKKTVDPRDKTSPSVIQLETAMGAAISCFPGAIALTVPRTRFAPVKTTSDLLALRSDAYTLTPDFRIQLAPERGGVPPNIKLDSSYKFVDALDALTPHGSPSLIDCERLVVEGSLEFAKGVVIKGSCTFRNRGVGKKVVSAGTYDNAVTDLGDEPVKQFPDQVTVAWYQSFQGKWRNEENEIVSISEAMILWPDSLTTSIAPGPDGTSFTMEEYTASLKPDGCLHFTDGDVWRRVE